MATLKSMRTAAIARRAGCSAQQIRNLERDGVLPRAARTAAGYRIYEEIHLYSALAYRALVESTGPVEAKRIMRTVHEFPASRMLSFLDAAHARLDRERTDLKLARQAAEAISDESMNDVRPSDAMSVSELAAALGVRASTLRHWDAEHLVVPDRVWMRGARRYSPSHVRDARIIHQLRSAGYRIDTLRALMSDLPRGQRWTDVGEALQARDISIEARSRALLDAAAVINTVISLAAKS